MNITFDTHLGSLRILLLIFLLILYVTLFLSTPFICVVRLARDVTERIPPHRQRHGRVICPPLQRNEPRLSITLPPRHGH